MTNPESLKNTALLWMAATILWLFLAKESFAQSTPYPCWGMGSWMMGGAMGWIGGIIMMLFGVLVLVALVLFIRWMVSAGGNRHRSLSHGQFPQGPAESAVDILRRRYARGEISREQFDSMRHEVE